MTEVERQLLLLPQLKAMGVKAFDSNPAGTFHVEFFPTEPRASTSPTFPESMDLGGPKMCHCGHDEIHHNDQGVCTDIECADKDCNLSQEATQ